LSIVDRLGNVRPLLEGLPSDIEVTGQPSGPNGVQVRSCCVVELTIGEGNGLRFDPVTGPPVLIPNPEGISSPIFSSVLRLTFDTPLDRLNGSFTLEPGDQDRLADGFAVELTNDVGEKLRISLLADLRDFRPDPVINVRNSNPFSLSRRASGTVVVVDAGDNSIVQVPDKGPPKTVLRFAPVPNPLGPVPPVSDAVPTSIRPLRQGEYLVSLLVGVPFAPGTASIRLVNLRERTERELIGGLTSVTDVLPVGKDIYVLEISTNLAEELPGRLLRFAGPDDAEPDEVAAGLVGASGMAYSSRDKAIYIAELFLGQITRVEVK
jgi:hypothetical protein